MEIGHSFDVKNATLSQCKEERPRIRPQGPTRRADTEGQVVAIGQAITLVGEADEGCDATERRPGNRDF
jgi:hypothetical protein